MPEILGWVMTSLSVHPYGILISEFTCCCWLYKNSNWPFFALLTRILPLRGKYMKPASSAGKRVRARCFSLAEKVARVFLTNHGAELSQIKANTKRNYFRHSVENHCRKQTFLAFAQFKTVTRTTFRGCMLNLIAYVFIFFSPDVLVS